MANFDGQVAVVTGASRGFGSATALRLAAEGANVVINYRQSDDLARELAARVEKLGRRALLVRADVSDPQAAQTFADQVMDAFGRVDILVNNAGVLDIRPFVDQTLDVQRHMIEINVMGVIQLTAAFLGTMVDRGAGCIVNVASQLAHTGGKNFAVYAGTKGFILAFTRSLAREVGPAGIRVNAVCPGSIVTDMNRSIYTTDEQVAQRVSTLPLRRMGSPDDVAAAIAYIASADAGFITGQCLDVNGGATTV